MWERRLWAGGRVDICLHRQKLYVPDGIWGKILLHTTRQPDGKKNRV